VVDAAQRWLAVAGAQVEDDPIEIFGERPSVKCAHEPNHQLAAQVCDSVEQVEKLRG